MNTTAAILEGLARGIVAKRESDKIEKLQADELAYRDQERSRLANERLVADSERARARVQADGQMLYNPSYIVTKDPDALKAEVDEWNVRAQAVGLRPADYNQLESIAENAMRDDLRAVSKEYAGDLPRVQAYALDRWGKRFTRKFPDMAPQAAVTGPTAGMLASIAPALGSSAGAFPGFAPKGNISPEDLNAWQQANPPDTAHLEDLSPGAPLSRNALSELATQLLSKGQGPTRNIPQPRMDLKQAAPGFGAIVPQVGNPLAQLLSQMNAGDAAAAADQWPEPAQMVDASAPGAGVFGKLAEQLPEAKKSTFDMIYGGAGGTNYTKDEQTYAKTLRDGIKNGSVTSKTAQESWRAMYPNKPIPADIPEMTPSATTADVMGRGKRADKKQFASDLADAVSGDLTQRAWYQLYPDIEYPGMGAMASATLAQKKSAVDLAGKRYNLSAQELEIAKERLQLAKNADARGANADARAAAKAAAGPAAKPPRGMSTEMLDWARMLGYGEDAIINDPGGVLRDIERNKMVPTAGVFPDVTDAARASARNYKSTAKPAPAKAGGGKLATVKAEVDAIKAARPNATPAQIAQYMAKRHGGSPADYNGVASGRK